MLGTPEVFSSRWGVWEEGRVGEEGDYWNMSLFIETITYKMELSKMESGHLCHFCKVLIFLL